MSRRDGWEDPRTVLPSFVLALPAVLAQAGGGSSGFSGGGGGGGGGGSYSGGGSSGDTTSTGSTVLLVVVVLLFVVGGAALRRMRKARAERARQEREAAVRLAAVEASDDDASFDPNGLVEDAGALFLAVQNAWDAGDRPAMQRLLGPDLLEEWRRRLGDFDEKGWHSRVKVISTPAVRLVGLVNRAADADDRVVVFVAAKIQSWVVTDTGKHLYREGADDSEVQLEQYWTLGRRDGEWILLSIEEEAEGRHHLHGELIAVPSADPALRGQSRTDLAVADAAGPASEIADLTSTTFSRDARAAALDLSLVDDRFSPDVLTVAVEALVDAWTEAIDGADAGLERRATPEAVAVLLYGGDADRDVRTVVRGLRVQEVTIDALNGQADPPTMGVTVRYRGAWYRENRDTQAVVDGSRESVTERAERWTLALVDDAEVPWRLVGAPSGR